VNGSDVDIPPCFHRERQLARMYLNEIHCTVRKYFGKVRHALDQLGLIERTQASATRMMLRLSTEVPTTHLTSDLGS
jgi:hypothetical protein